MRDEWLECGLKGWVATASGKLGESVDNVVHHPVVVVRDTHQSICYYAVTHAAHRLAPTNNPPKREAEALPGVATIPPSPIQQLQDCIGFKSILSHRPTSALYESRRRSAVTEERESSAPIPQLVGKRADWRKAPTPRCCRVCIPPRT